MGINNNFNTSSFDNEFGFTFTSDRVQTQGMQGTSTIFQSIDGDQDTMGIFQFTPMHFLALPTYPSPAQSPTLPQPTEGQEQGEAQSYGATEQKMVKEFFSGQVVKNLQGLPLTTDEKKAVYESIMTGTPLKDNTLNLIASDVSQKAALTTQQEGNLPPSWIVTSTDANDWIPLPILPYGEEQQGKINEYYDQALIDKGYAFISENILTITPEEQANLIEAIKTGKVSSDIADIYLELTADARVETQQAFSLSSTWFKGTTSVEDWKPINIGIVTPAKVAAAKVSELTDNTINQLTDFETKAKETLDSLPPGDIPSRLALTEFLSIIGKAIQDLKGTLREIQIKDAEKTKENSKAKLDQISERKVRSNEQMAKMDKMQQKQRSMGDFSKVMKVLVPVIAAIAMVVSVIIAGVIGAAVTVGTAGIGVGAGIAIVLAGMAIAAAIGAALLGYSILDSTLDVTQKAVKLFDKVVRDILPPDTPDWAVNLFKAAIVIAAVAVLLFIAIAAIAVTFITGSGPSAIANASIQAALTAIVKAIMQGVQQVTLLIAAQLLMASQVIPDLISSILKASGVDKKTIQDVGIAVMVIQTVLVMGVGLLIGAASGAGLKSAASGATSTATGIAENVKTSVQATLNAIVDMIKKPFEAIAKVCKELFRIFKLLIEQGFKAVVEDIIKNIGQSLKNVGKNLQDDLLGIVKAIMATITHGTQAAGGIAQGSMQLEASKLLRDIGDLKSLEESIIAMLQSLEKLLKNIQAGMSVRDDFIQQLQQMFTNVYNSASKSHANLFNSIQG